MGLKKTIEDQEFIEEQLYETKKALFAAKSVREIKFLERKLLFLKDKAKKLNIR